MALICTELSFSWGSPKKTDGAAFRLSSIDLTLERGGITSLMGRGGSGKSTLISCLSAALRPQGGQIHADSFPQENPAYAGLVRRVSQQPERQLFAATAFEDVAFGLKKQGCSFAECEHLVGEVLSALGFDPTQAKVKSPFAYSGGERRLLAIAGMLVMEPAYLLLDEPAAGLDAAHRKRLFSELLARVEKGMGLLFSTHRPEDALEYADTLMVLEQGQASFCGAPEQYFLRETSGGVTDGVQAGLEAGAGVAVSLEAGAASLAGGDTAAPAGAIAAAPAGAIAAAGLSRLFCGLNDRCFPVGERLWKDTDTAFAAITQAFANKGKIKGRCSEEGICP